MLAFIQTFYKIWLFNSNLVPFSFFGQQILFGSGKKSLYNVNQFVISFEKHENTFRGRLAINFYLVVFFLCLKKVENKILSFVRDFVSLKFEIWIDFGKFSMYLFLVRKKIKYHHVSLTRMINSNNGKVYFCFLQFSAYSQLFSIFFSLVTIIIIWIESFVVFHGAFHQKTDMQLFFFSIMIIIIITNTFDHYLQWLSSKTIKKLGWTDFWLISYSPMEPNHQSNDHHHHNQGHFQSRQSWWWWWLFIIKSWRFKQKTFFLISFF